MEQIRDHGNDFGPYSISCAKRQQLNQIVHRDAWQISSLKLGIQNNDTICNMSFIPPSRTIIQLVAALGHLRSRSFHRKQPQSLWGDKSKDEKNSSRIEIVAKHRKKVLRSRSSLRFTNLIIRACWTRNQSPEVPQVQRWMCSAVVLRYLKTSRWGRAHGRARRHGI